MTYLLIDQPNPYTPQGGYPRRGVARPSGTIIVHTTEGAWSAGVQSLVNLVRTRTDYGCYHRACDWADITLLYPWEWETWQDSETNPWAVGISAACRTSDWGNMPADVEEGFYRNMARMAADFVAYMDTEHGVTVPLKRISGAEARSRVPGFCAHGDSGIARSDPGVGFDWGRFFTYTAAALGNASIGYQGDTITEIKPKEWDEMASKAEIEEIVKKYADGIAGTWFKNAYDQPVQISSMLNALDKNQNGNNAVIVRKLNEILAEVTVLRSSLSEVAKNPDITPAALQDMFVKALGPLKVQITNEDKA